MGRTMRSRGVSSYRTKKRTKRRGNKLSRRLSKRRVKRTTKRSNKRSNKRLNRRASKHMRNNRKSYRKRGGKLKLSPEQIENLLKRNDLPGLTREDIDNFVQRMNNEGRGYHKLPEIIGDLRNISREKASSEGRTSTSITDFGEKVSVPSEGENYIMVAEDGAAPVGIKYLRWIRNGYQNHHEIEYIGEENNGKIDSVDTDATFYPYNEAFLH